MRLEPNKGVWDYDPVEHPVRYRQNASRHIPSIQDQHMAMVLNRAGELEFFYNRGYDGKEQWPRVIQIPGDTEAHRHRFFCAMRASVPGCPGVWLEYHEVDR